MTNLRWLVRRTTDTGLPRYSSIDSYCGLSVQVVWRVVAGRKGLLDVAALFRSAEALVPVVAFWQELLRRHLTLE